MLKRLRSLLTNNRLVGGVFVLALLQFGASVAGLVRDRVLFQTFPAFGVTDVYFASFRLSDFLFQACIMSALGTVLVPVLAGYHAHGKTEERDRVLWGTMHLGALVFGGIALVLFFLFPVIAPYLVEFDGDKLELYIQFGRLALLSNFLFVFGSTFGQHLITVQRYWIYGLTPILYTAGTIAGTIFLTPAYGAYGPMLGTLMGALVYTLLRAVAVFRSGVRFRASLWHPDFSSMGVLMLPRMLSLGALQAQLLLFDRLGSGLDQGAISLNLASRNFQSVVVGVVGIALAQAVYSPLSQAAARLDVRAYAMYLRKAITYAILLTVPGAIALVLLSPVAARLVSLQQVLAIFHIALAMYAISIPFESLNHLLLRAYYALRDTLLPALSSVLGGGVAVIVAWVLVGRYGVYALGIGFTAGQIMQTATLAAFLPWRLRKMKRMAAAAVV